MTGTLSEALIALASSPFLQGTVAAGATFVLEDPTTVACGLLVAAGHMGFLTALAGVSAGIAVGDIGLYGIGSLLGPRILRLRWLSQGTVERTRDWYSENLVSTLVISRFVPGMRLPTYLGAGVAGAPFLRFASIAALASLAWSTLLLALTWGLGSALLPWLGTLRWPVAIAALVLLFVLRRRRARRAASETRIASAFEFAPPWLFYIPVGLHYAWLAIRYRGLLLPAVANPSVYSGGLIRESKSSILDLVAGDERRWLAPYATFDRPAGDPPVDTMVAAARDAMESAGIGYPIVAKPDIGQRGAGVWPIRADAELGEYLRRFPGGARVVLQRMVGESRAEGIREAGVLYYRKPGDDEGTIFSITLKSFPCVTGDGRRTLRELIEADRRAAKIREVYFKRHGDGLDRVPADGETVRLVFAGNHCQGAIFRDGTPLANAALAARVRGIVDAMPDFHFGRFDVRFDDLDAFLRGEDFQVVEINGAGAEATHIWDASMSLADAYAVLFRQYRILFEIGDAVRRSGRRPIGVLRFLRDVVAYRKLAAAYPATR